MPGNAVRRTTKLRILSALNLGLLAIVVPHVYTSSQSRTMTAQSWRGTVVRKVVGLGVRNLAHHVGRRGRNHRASMACSTAMCSTAESIWVLQAPTPERSDYVLIRSALKCQRADKPPAPHGSYTAPDAAVLPRGEPAQPLYTAISSVPPSATFKGFFSLVGSKPSPSDGLRAGGATAEAACSTQFRLHLDSMLHVKTKRPQKFLNFVFACWLSGSSRPSQ